MAEEKLPAHTQVVHVAEIHLEGSAHISIHDDVVTWAERQAALLRRMAAGEQVNEQIDWEEIAEEIESLGISERRSLTSKVRTIIEHLAKLEASSALNPRPGWKDTVSRERAEITDLLEASPGMRGSLDEVVRVQLPRGLRLTASSLANYGETPRVPLDQIRYTTDQVIGDWFPNEAV